MVDCQAEAVESQFGAHFHAQGIAFHKLPIFRLCSQSQGANASNNWLEPSQLAISQLSAADVPSLRLPVSICHPSPDHRNCAPLSMFPASAAGPMGRVWVALTQRANRDGCDGSFEPATPVIQAAKRGRSGAFVLVGVRGTTEASTTWNELDELCDGMPTYLYSE